MLRAAAPDTGRALEIASGTGQHIAALAAACPRLHWHPTEVAPERITSINAYAAEAALPNLQAAQTLDATETGWAEGGDPYDLVYLGNLLHLIPDDAASTLIAESAKALTKKGNS